LGGATQHLHVSSGSFRSVESGLHHVITVYDSVPGGSGHLLSLMKFGDDSSEALRDLSALFTKTLAHLEKCDCEEGCYKCLLNYENQFEHEEILKTISLNWLKQFLNADGWKKSKKGLAREISENSAFDGYSEVLLVEGLLRSSIE
jgi:DEAD/DEAH box helicase domain-containing protein